jgi:hypothetical protein
MKTREVATRLGGGCLRAAATNALFTAHVGFFSYDL